MNKSQIIAGGVGVIVGIIIWSLLGSSWGGIGSMMWGRWGNWMGSGQNIMDAHFIEQMIPHHEDAILMAGIALEKAEHQEIKQLAQDIERTQSEEIEKMQKWYRDWYGNGVSFVPVALAHGQGMMHGGMMGDSTDLEALENAKPFDKEFIEQMIPHHQMAVMMAQMLLRGTNRSEMKGLAEDIIEAQTAEIEKMRTWYRSWYGL